MKKLIGRDDDDSLFGWAVRHYCTGWLVCDDRSHEVADFIHLDQNQLSLIAIKSKDKPSSRSTSTAAVQTVQAQATKNLFFLDDLTELSKYLKKVEQGLVVFFNGERQTKSHNFLEALTSLRPATTDRTAVIVQPQLQQNQIDKAHERLVEGKRETTDLGMMRNDSMLRALDSRCATLGISLVVQGSQTQTRKS